MSNEFIHPNFHVILIHYPLALLIVGTLIELFAFLWRRSSFRAAGRWMILIGALSLVPAATSGLYAMYDVNRSPTTGHDATWTQVRAESPIQAQAWEMMRQHAWYNAIGSVAILLLVVIWLGASDRLRSRLHLIFLILLLAGLTTIVLGAWHGGELVYRHGVGVENVRAGAASAPLGEQMQLKRGVDYYLPPIQLHVILAGFAFALALASIGASLRYGAVDKVRAARMPDPAEISYAFSPGGTMIPRSPAAQLNVSDDPTALPLPAYVPVNRFWLLAALLGAAAALAGFWYLAIEHDTTVPRELWEVVADRDGAGGLRRIAHVAVGVGIIVLALLLAMTGRAAARRRVIIWFFSLLLLAAIAAQIWLGALLLLDGHAGPWSQFNGSAVETPNQPATAPAATQAAPATTQSAK